MNKNQYTVIKLKLKHIVACEFNMNISEKQEINHGLIISEQDSLLLDQIRIVTEKSINETKVTELIIVEAKKSDKNNPNIEYIIEHGFTYNGTHYSRLGKSASQSKEGITVFISDLIYDEIMQRSQLDLSITTAVISKYEAQRCLIFSTCTLIQSKLPYIVIVDEFKKSIPNQYIRYVNENRKTFIDKDTGEKKEYTSRDIEEKYMDVEISPFDGGGVHSIEFSNLVSKELELDYVAAGLQIRLPFMKGYSVAFDFSRYFKEVLHQSTITDIFGKVHFIDDVDCIWNTSMWKSYKLFKNKYGNNGFNEYIAILNKYQYKLGISKYSHHTKYSNLMARMNFQYLQCLDLWNPKYTQYFDDKFPKDYDILDSKNAGKIITLAKYSTALFQKVITGDKFYSCKFLGKENSTITPEDNAMVQAILINDTMLKDVAVKQNIYRKLKKQIHQMKLGKMYCDGFYHTAIIDVIAYLEYSAGLAPIGCLGENEFYMDTLGYGKFTSFRSPLVCPSEVNNIDVIDLKNHKNWFAHLKDQDLIMFNTYDIALPQQGGQDLDGDANYICKNDIIYKAKIDKPIIININDKATVKETDYCMKNIIKYEMATRSNRIGEITNVATSILNQTFQDEKWKKTAYDNISLLRIFQGVEIDSIKTGFRWNLSKYLRNFLKQLPLFLLYNYPDKLNKYFKTKKINHENKDHKLKLNGFKSPSPLNELCHYIDLWEKKDILWSKTFVDTRCLLLNREYELNDRLVFREIKHLINEYAIHFKSILEDSNKDDEVTSLIDKLSGRYKSKIDSLSEDKQEIANYVIKVSYSSLSMNKSFVWKMYSTYILKNLTDNSPEQKHYEIVYVPTKTKQSKEFLGKDYEMRKIEDISHV